MTQPNHWCRVVMNAQTLMLVKRLPHEAMDALEISGNGWENLVQFKSYKSLIYPVFNLCQDQLPNSSDLIIAEQVFEHLPYPHRAAKNVYASLRPGGHALITTPFLIKEHPSPLDCSRWTEDGLKFLFEEAGFPLAKMVSGSWGNRACVMANFDSWPEYNPETHSLENEPDFPMVVWLLAQK